MAVRIAVQVHAQELEEGRVEQANLADGYKTRVETLGASKMVMCTVI